MVALSDTSESGSNSSNSVAVIAKALEKRRRMLWDSTILVLTAECCFSWACLNQGDKQTDLNLIFLKKSPIQAREPSQQRPPGGASTAVASWRGLHSHGGMRLRCRYEALFAIQWACWEGIEGAVLQNYAVLQLCCKPAPQTEMHKCRLQRTMCSDMRAESVKGCFVCKRNGNHTCTFTQ
jgi:hypothetical protein